MGELSEKIQSTLKKAGIDTETGLTYSEDVSVYQEVLLKYYQSIDEKAGLIQKFEEEKNIPEYTRMVHSLKSTSRSIGAEKLADMAMELERCGNENDIETIKENTPKALELYRSYKNVLSCVVPENENQPKHSISEQILKNQYDALCNQLDDYNVNEAKDIIEKIKSYVLPASHKQLFVDLCNQFEDYEYEEALALAQQLAQL